MIVSSDILLRILISVVLISSLLCFISLTDEMIEEFAERPLNEMFGHNRIDGLWKARLFESVDQEEDALYWNRVPHRRHSLL